VTGEAPLFDGKALAQASALLLPLVLNAGEAAAKGGEYGVLEGRTFAFIHPIVMGGLFLATAWTGYLGWQWRTVRTLAGDIRCVAFVVRVVRLGLACYAPYLTWPVFFVSVRCAARCVSLQHANPMD
jgi:hypothetical protein